MRVLKTSVHRLVGGVLESASVGDPVPDWVTNPDAWVDDAPPVTVEPVELVHGGVVSKRVDVVDMSLAELREAAVELGVAKSGSKGDLVARINAKLAEVERGDVPEGDVFERAAALGIDVDASMSESDVQWLIDNRG